MSFSRPTTHYSITCSTKIFLAAAQRAPSLWPLGIWNRWLVRDLNKACKLDASSLWVLPSRMTRHMRWPDFLATKSLDDRWQRLNVEFQLEKEHRSCCRDSNLGFQYRPIPVLWSSTDGQVIPFQIPGKRRSGVFIRHMVLRWFSVHTCWQ